ncbi:MAG: hypothetical protein GEU99_13980 [Luteitalea sp.]|nr:hypothetical protein [Luteitalea sp.]
MESHTPLSRACGVPLRIMAKFLTAARLTASAKATASLAEARSAKADPLTPCSPRTDTDRMLLSRRDLLDLAVRAAAVPGAVAFFSTWLHAASQQQHASASHAPPEPPLLRDYTPTFFGPDDFEALQAFTEILIPTDETPGAREAHCAHYIDFVLQANTAYAPELQQQWRDAMAALREAGFHSADTEGRAALVEAMSRPEHDASVTHPAYVAYRLIKQHNTFAFYTSRAGMIDTLDYKGNSYNASFPACDHPEHHVV